MNQAAPPQIVFIPHGNIQYSQLPPDRRGWVVTQSYGKLFDLISARGYTMAFEASGETIDFMARNNPDVMDKLRGLVRDGQVEPVASPYTHLMVANIDPEIAVQTLRHGLDTWERLTGVRPETGWNPECSWNSTLPEIYREAGFQNLVMDGDSFFLGFEEIRKATGLHFDVRGHSNKNALFRIEEFIDGQSEYLRYLTNPSRVGNGLRMIFRSDMMSNYFLWFLMGVPEVEGRAPVTLDDLRHLYQRWKVRIAQTGSFILPYAEDAEYIGTTAYFYVKQFGQARFFELAEESVQRFQSFVDLAVAEGYQLATPRQVIDSSTAILDNSLISRIENGVAWHGGTAKAWANTPQARILDPVCRDICLGIKRVTERTGRTLDTIDGDLRLALRQVTSAYVSDSRWPPAPTSPGRFNVQESLRDMKHANQSLRRAMEAAGLAAEKALYSPRLMETQIEAIEQELMARPYFGEAR